MFLAPIALLLKKKGVLVKYRDSKGKVRTFRGRVDASGKDIRGTVKLIGRKKIQYIREDSIIEIKRKRERKRKRVDDEYDGYC